MINVSIIIVSSATCPKSFCKTAIKKTIKINTKKYGESSNKSPKRPFFGWWITFLKNDQDKKYIKPILNISTGDKDIPGSLIHLFAPPEAVTKEAGKKGIMTIKKSPTPNSVIPVLCIILFGFNLDIHHIRYIQNIPTKPCLKI